MTDMDNQGEVVGAATSSNSDAAWADHTQSAVREFLKTAVVIDNQPWVKQSTPVKENLSQVAITEESGLGDDLVVLEVPSEEASEYMHDLNLRAVSDEFASKGIACAFVLPDDDDRRSDEKKRRAVSAAKVSDLVVIDWYLERKNESLTLQILEEIAASDTAENGRLRLICVYTGEPLKPALLDDVKRHLAAGGIVLKDIPELSFCAASDNTFVVLRNKVTTPASELPGELICLFSRFADGLVPSFSLAAVGAIRKNAHHILTRFGKWLDSAYIANRLITNPPADVSEMLRELFVAECDSALGLECVADRYLEVEPISKWLAAKRNSLEVQQAGTVSIDYEFLGQILRNGIKDDKAFFVDEGEVKVNTDHRYKISAALAGGLNFSRAAEYEFARLVVLKREVRGRTKLMGEGEWKPSLTTGSILNYKLKEKNIDEGGEVDSDVYEHLVCLTPACDTLRLKSETPFVFLRAQVVSQKYDFILPGEGGCHTFLKLDSKNPVIRTFCFSPDQNLQRVFAVSHGADHFTFTDVDEREFTWLGEVRYTRAASEMAALVQNWMRIGISDSEYLRLAAVNKVG